MRSQTPVAISRKEPGRVESLKTGMVGGSLQIGGQREYSAAGEHRQAGAPLDDRRALF